MFKYSIAVSAYLYFILINYNKYYYYLNAKHLYPYILITNIKWPTVYLWLYVQYYYVL